MMDLSIIVAVYNHEYYIRQALNSILDQRVSFTYEVLIGEDNSTDHTREVLKEMESSLPSNFHIFYREVNYGATKNFADLYNRSTGRYFIVLEGDDYWINSDKLQREYDFLESNPEYIAVAHNTRVVNESGIPINVKYPECHQTEYTFDDFKKGILPGQTTTKMIRNYHKYEGIIKGTDIDVGNYPGDRREAFLLCINGKVKCIQEKWSAYRLVISHGSSYTATTTHYDREEELYYWKQLAEYTLRYFPDNRNVIQFLLERVIYCYFVGRCQKYQYKRKYDISRYYKLIPDKVGLYVYMCRIALWPFRSIPRLVKKSSWKYKSK